MKREQKFAKPFDLCHSIMFNEYPQIYTELLGVPGHFVRKINAKVHLKDGTGGEMDSAYIADPDNKVLFERVAVALEHQSTPVGESKLKKFGDYDVQLVVDEHLPTLIAVASHLKEELSRNILQRSPSDITKVYFLDLGEKNIRERLNSVSKIIEYNKSPSDEIALNLGVIVLYAPRENACEITKKVVNLYLEINKNLDLRMEYCLYSVISVMIDAYFDDEKEYERLINMIDEKTSNNTKKAYASQQDTMERLKRSYQDRANIQFKLDMANKHIADIQHERDMANKHIADIQHERDMANENLDAANSRIAELEAEVKRLNAK